MLCFPSSPLPGNWATCAIDATARGVVTESRFRRSTTNLVVKEAPSLPITQSPEEYCPPLKPWTAVAAVAGGRSSCCRRATSPIVEDSPARPFSRGILFFTAAGCCGADLQCGGPLPLLPRTAAAAAAAAAAGGGGSRRSTSPVVKEAFALPIIQRNIVLPAWRTIFKIHKKQMQFTDRIYYFYAKLYRIRSKNIQKRC